LKRKIIAINLESEQNFPNKIKAELMGHKKSNFCFYFFMQSAQNNQKLLAFP